MRRILSITFLLLLCAFGPVSAQEPSQQTPATLLWEEYISLEMNAIALSGDGTAVACAGEQGVKVLAEDGSTRWMTETPAYEIALSENASRVLVGGSNLRLYDQTGTVIWRNTSDYFVLSNAISPRGDLVYSAWDDSTVLRYNMTGMTIYDPDIDTDLICMGVTDNGTHIVGGTLTGDLILWDLLGNVKWTRTYPGEKAVMDIALSSDGTFIAYTIDDQAYLINRAGRTLWNKPLAHAAGISISADGSSVAVAHVNGISVFDREGTLKEAIQKGRKMLDVSFSDDGTKLAACDQKNAYLYSFTAGEPETLTEPQKPEESTSQQQENSENLQSPQAASTTPVASGNGIFSVLCVTGSLLATVLLYSKRQR